MFTKRNEKPNVDNPETNKDHIMPVLLRAVIALTAGLLFRYVFHRQTLGLIVLCIACVFLVAALSPALRRVLRKLEKWLVLAVGTVLTVALLTPFFYLCFVPGRLILLLTGNDPMKRKLDPNADSYWISLDSAAKTPESYRRQS